MAAKNHSEFCKSMHRLTTGNCHMQAECEECKEIWNAAIKHAEVLKPSHNTGSPKLVEDLECARDWLLPGRAVLQIEIDNCVSELNDIINQLRAGA